MKFLSNFGEFYRRAELVLMIRVVELNEDLEERFIDYVRRDVFINLPTLYAWKFERSRFKIYIALRNHEVVGAIRIRGAGASLAGVKESAEALIEKIRLNNFRLLCPEDLSEEVLKRFSPRKVVRTLLMVLNKGEEKLYRSHEVVDLEPSDASEISELLRRSSDWWSGYTDDKILEMFRRGFNWIGIIRDSRICSIGSFRIMRIDLSLPTIAHIANIATDSRYRGRGFATGIISEILARCFREADHAILYVEAENEPAIRLYQKIGFKPHRKMTFITV